MVRPTNSPSKRRKKITKEEGESVKMATQASKSGVQEPLPPSASDILRPLWQLTSLPSSGELALRASKEEEEDPSKPGKSRSSQVGSATKAALSSISTPGRMERSLKRSLPSLHAEHAKAADEQLSPKPESRLGWSRTSSDSYDTKKLRDLRGANSNVGGTKSGTESVGDPPAASIQKYREFIQLLQSHENEDDLTWLRYAIEDL